MAKSIISLENHKDNEMSILTVLIIIQANKISTNIPPTKIFEYYFIHSTPERPYRRIGLCRKVQPIIRLDNYKDNNEMIIITMLRIIQAFKI
jgi:hypothetical protein